MPTFLYLCPNMGLHVQGWVADDPATDQHDTYESVVCTACRQVHLVNPSTGKVLGDDEE
jgi:hypothetical protein